MNDYPHGHMAGKRNARADFKYAAFDPKWDVENGPEASDDYIKGYEAGYKAMHANLTQQKFARSERSQRWRKQSKL